MTTVAGDLSNRDALTEAARGAGYVVHAATRMRFANPATR